MSNNDTTITIVDNSFPVPFAFTITQLDDDTMILEFNDGTGVTHTTYKH